MNVNKLRKKIFEMNKELRKMREEKKLMEIAENEEIYQKGMLDYSDSGNYGFRNNLRLIGRNFWTRSQKDCPALDAKRDYYKKCKAFDVALNDLKEFYLHNNHLVIIDDLIEKSEEGYSDAKRDLTAIFKLNKRKKNRHNY